MKITPCTLISLLLIFLSCSKNPIEPQKALPDLVIQNVTYSVSYSRGVDFTLDTLWITNVGQADFYGYLHVSAASEKYYQEARLFSTSAMVYFASTPDSVYPGRIAPGQTIVGLMGIPFPTDTSVIRFHIQTDTIGMKPGDPSASLYAELNYANNDYLLTVVH